MNREVNWMAMMRPIATGLLIAPLLFACATKSDEVGESASELAFETSSDGAILSVKKTGEDSGEQRGATDYGLLGEEPDDVEIQAGCVHIRWCNEPNSPREVVCDTNDRPCPPDARLEECIDDADAVCGDWRRMDFDPAIRFP